MQTVWVPTYQMTTTVTARRDWHLMAAANRLYLLLLHGVWQVRGVWEASPLRLQRSPISFQAMKLLNLFGIMLLSAAMWAALWACVCLVKSQLNHTPFVEVFFKG